MILLPSSPTVPSAVLPAILLLLLLLLLTCATLIVSAAAGRHDCPPSSCGNLTNITYPFRLKDDPPNFGDSNYELTCDHLNRTILTLLSHTYYVTNITYIDFTGNYFLFSIQVNYAGIEKYNKGSCGHLLLRTVSKLRSNKYYETSGWVTMVNCSKEVKKNNKSMQYYEYKHVPCLSHNNPFIYLIPSGLTVAQLMPSCRFLAS